MVEDSFVWVWIGEPDKAQSALVPRAPWLADPAYNTVCGMEPLAARANLLVDNLLDLSHETYLHGGYIGTPEVANTPITTEVDDEAGIVYVSRHMHDADCPPSTPSPRVCRAASHAGKTSSSTRRACTCCTAASPPWASCRPSRVRTTRPSTSKSSTR